MTARGFDGLRVLSLESRRRQEMQQLIEKHGGRATVVESLREVPQEAAHRVAAFADRLERGERVTLVCMTGVGTRMFLRDLVRSRPHALPLLREARLVARGTKPRLALREYGLPAEQVRRPHTWHEVLAHLLDTTGDGEHLTLLEFGERTPPLMLSALNARNLTVETLPVYRCALPADPGPLRQAVRDTAAGAFDVLLLSSGTQIVHFVQVARELHLEVGLRGGLASMMVASIGPACSEALGELRVGFDLEANPHKMGMLVRLAGENAQLVLGRKRTGRQPVGS